MKHVAATRMGLITAALVFIFSLTAIVPAEARQLNFKNQLRKSGVSMKIVKLDRTDGFVFGVSFAGPNNTFVIAPGPDGMCLIQASGNEVIMQRDTAGTMQILETKSDLISTLCIVKAVVTFFSDWTVCAGDAACMFTSVLKLVTNVLACNNGETTTSTTTTISVPVASTTTTNPTTTSSLAISTTTTTI